MSLARTTAEMPLLELDISYIASSHFHSGSFVLCKGVFVVTVT